MTKPLEMLAAEYRKTAGVLKSWLDAHKNSDNLVEQREVYIVERMHRECIAAAKYLENYYGDRSKCALYEDLKITASRPRSEG